MRLAYVTRVIAWYLVGRSWHLPSLHAVQAASQRLHRHVALEMLHCCSLALVLYTTPLVPRGCFELVISRMSGPGAML
jgi:hypothetical protein